MGGGRGCGVVGEAWAIGKPAGCQPRGGGAWLTGRLVPQSGGTPLHLAAFSGREAVVGLLLNAGADKDTKGKVRGGGGAGCVGGGAVWFVFVRLCCFQRNYLFKVCFV